LPIIKQLQELGADIYISGSPQQLTLITGEFENIKIIHLPYLKIKLSKNNSQVFNLIMQLPRFLIQIFREHIALGILLNREAFDLVISDNCYGCWNKKVYTVFITHQLNVQLPQRIEIFQNLINLVNHWFISKFDICWVPDFEADSGLSGALSHPLPKSLKVNYIGILSRFNLRKAFISLQSENIKKKILFIISGPEKQRTLFETILRNEAVKLQNFYICIFVRGLPEHTSENLPVNWYNHVPSHELEKLITEADYIVCRPGYSSIMDLFTLQKTAIIVPTPGQTEQEYLSVFLEKKGLFFRQDQEKINIAEGIENLQKKETYIKSLYVKNDNLKLMQLLKAVPYKI
jgi:hypothetical protein